jgi:hypothetical protein
MKWSGKLEHVDLEGGLWQIRAKEGTFTLRGRVPAGLSGKDVEVEGDLDEGFGFSMNGPAIAVRNVRAR